MILFALSNKPPRYQRLFQPYRWTKEKGDLVDLPRFVWVSLSDLLLDRSRSSDYPD